MITKHQNLQRHFLILFLSLIPLLNIEAVSIEGDASVFFPTNSSIKEMYGSCWPNFGITIDHVHLLPYKAPFLSLFGEVNYLFPSGKSLGGNEPTSMQLLPLTLGLKLIKEVHPKIEVYVGLAPRYYFLKIKNDSPYVPRKVHDNGCGFYATSGAFFSPMRGLIIDLFFSYSYIKFKPLSSTSQVIGFSTNVSGFDWGGGLGWKF